MRFFKYVNKSICEFPVFTIKIDFRNMSASGEVRFENSLYLLQGTFTAKTQQHSRSLPCNGIFSKERIEEFQVFSIQIYFWNMLVSVKVRF